MVGLQIPFSRANASRSTSRLHFQDPPHLFSSKNLVKEASLGGILHNYDEVASLAFRDLCPLRQKGPLATFHYSKKLGIEVNSFEAFLALLSLDSPFPLLV